MILEGIVALIVEAGSGLEAITANRIFPVTLPENIAAAAYTGGFPAMTYQVVGGTGQPGLKTSGPQRWRVQFDCYGVGTATASGYSAAKGVREALRLLLNGFSGALPDGSVVESILWIQPIDYFESAARQYRCACEFYVNFNF